MNIDSAGMKVMTMNSVKAIVARRSRTLEPSAASGATQITYHGINHARLASRACVAQPE
jgi:hypothetical protein